MKAEIVDTRGHKVTVSRRIELVQKKFVKKFQTLDSTLSRIDKDTGQVETTMFSTDSRYMFYDLLKNCFLFSESSQSQ